MAVAVMGRPSTDEPSFTASATGGGPVVVTDALAATVEDAPWPQAASATIAIAIAADSANGPRHDCLNMMSYAWPGRLEASAEYATLRDGLRSRQVETRRRLPLDVV
jgi:hypothetical protein